MAENPLGPLGDFSSSNPFNVKKAPAVDPLQAQAEEYQKIMSGRQGIYDTMSTLVGGPNMALIRDLNASRQRKIQQYKTNRADVENMYGQLSTNVAQQATNLGTSYDQSIIQGQQQATQGQQALSSELAAQDARRAAAAKELGIERESALTDYKSTDQLNKAMTDVLARNTDWTGLLGSQKNSALERALNLKTAVGNTKTDKVAAMTEAKDQVIDYYDQQIANERSKTAKRVLTEEGKLWMKGNTQKLSEYIQNALGLGKADANKYAAEYNQKTEMFDDPSIGQVRRADGSFVPRPSQHPAGKAGWHAEMAALDSKYYSQSGIKISNEPVPPAVQLWHDRFGSGNPINYGGGFVVPQNSTQGNMSYGN